MTHEEFKANFLGWVAHHGECGKTYGRVSEDGAYAIKAVSCIMWSQVVITERTRNDKGDWYQTITEVSHEELKATYTDPGENATNPTLLTDLSKRPTYREIAKE